MELVQRANLIIKKNENENLNERNEKQKKNRREFVYSFQMEVNFLNIFMRFEIS